MKNKEPLPYYKWYWRDYRANRKVQRLSYTARGFYRELLDEQWDKGFIPDDLEQLAEICGCPQQVLTNEWQMLSKCFEVTAPGKLANFRLERARSETYKTRVSRALAGRAGAIAKQMPANASKCHIAEHKQEQSNSSEPRIDNDRLSPTGPPDDLSLDDFKSITVPPPAMSDLYQQLIDREAPGRGGKVAAAQWLFGLVKRYAASDDVARGYAMLSMPIERGTNGTRRRNPLNSSSALSRRTSAETILDPFCGSGTTLVAAKKLGRPFSDSR